MIYILGKTYMCEDDELDEVILFASTNINDVLEYAYKNINAIRIHGCSLYIKTEDDDYSGEIVAVNKSMYDKFTNYSNFLCEDDNRLERMNIEMHMKHFCEAIESKEKAEKEKEDKIRKLRQEQEERKLYEKLKAKYGE